MTWQRAVTSVLYVTSISCCFMFADIGKAKKTRVSTCPHVASFSLIHYQLIINAKNYVLLLYELTRTNGECAECDSSSWSWYIELSRVSHDMFRIAHLSSSTRNNMADLDQSESSISNEVYLVWFCYPRLKKMADSLMKYGIYIDDLSKIRVLEPEAANQTNKLKDECQNFVSSKLC